MSLKYQDKLNQIDNCPLENETGDIVLYRLTNKPNKPEDFNPQAVILKPKYKDYCLGWGLSTFKTEKSLSELLNNLPNRLRNKYNSLSKIVVTDNDGIKYQTGTNKEHYTFFPNENLDLFTKFVYIDE